MLNSNKVPIVTPPHRTARVLSTAPHTTAASSRTWARLGSRARPAPSVRLMSRPQERSLYPRVIGCALAVPMLFGAVWLLLDFASGR
jgi:hypothetical protein